MTGTLVVAAPAKVNLFLHIGGRRADGYHDVESLVAFTAFGDEISLVDGDGFSLSVSGPFGAQLLDCEENLALKAAKLFAKKTVTTRGVQVGLRKNLPVASGLGGGSADGAAVLRGLMQLWQLDRDQKALRDTAELLGADVPVCVTSETSWMEGKGERVCPLPPLPKAGVLLVNPGAPVSTARAFAALGPRRGTGMRRPQVAFRDVYALVRFLNDTTNDLEGAAQTIVPIIADALKQMNDLPDVLLVRMSGSGASCFALFSDEVKAAAAARLLRARRPEWWVCATAFRDG